MTTIIILGFFHTNCLVSWIYHLSLVKLKSIRILITDGSFYFHQFNCISNIILLCHVSVSVYWIFVKYKMCKSTLQYRKYINSMVFAIEIDMAIIPYTIYMYLNIEWRTNNSSNLNVLWVESCSFGLKIRVDVNGKYGVVKLEMTNDIPKCTAVSGNNRINMQTNVTLDAQCLTLCECVLVYKMQICVL